jgi:GMP synthase-like glutamine amidotransferase
MRVLVIQNFDGTGLGQLRTALDEAGAQIDLRALHQGDALPETIDDHDALIVLGGGQSALADDDYPYLPHLVGFMRAFADSGRATLGVCLGAQLLARAFDAQVLVNSAYEFGWQTVALTPEGRDDPVLGALPESFPIFQWHDDHYMLPRGGARLAGNLVAHNQAYRVGAKAYGVQFHFEADRPHVEAWSELFAEWIAEREPDWGNRHTIDAERFGPQADSAGLALARAWVSVI